MCKILSVSRSNYYYEINRIVKEEESSEVQAVIQAFEDPRGNYGARKLKIELAKLDIILSRQKIRQIMNKNA